jgi:AcrR family transcriptional regulator
MQPGLGGSVSSTKRVARAPKRAGGAEQPAIVPEAAADGRALARRQKIISESARQFVRQGFDGTSMRDIAAASGIMAGSLYYHFASKEELFVAVHGAGMQLIEKAVRRSLNGIDDPWLRLEAAAAAHCEALLHTDLGAIVSPQFPSSMAKIQPRLIEQRDAYEQLIKRLIDDLKLPPELPARIFRLHFLGALNWVPTWYRANGSMSPSEIGRHLARMLRGLGNAALVETPAPARPRRARTR